MAYPTFSAVLLAACIATAYSCRCHAPTIQSLCGADFAIVAKVTSKNCVQQDGQYCRETMYEAQIIKVLKSPGQHNYMSTNEGLSTHMSTCGTSSVTLYTRGFRATCGVDVDIGQVALFSGSVYPKGGHGTCGVFVDIGQVALFSGSVYPRGQNSQPKWWLSTCGSWRKMNPTSNDIEQAETVLANCETSQMP